MPMDRRRNWKMKISKIILVTIEHHYLVVTTKHHIQLLAIKDRVLNKRVDVTDDVSERGE